ncbi:conserved repeat domain protein [Isosphaera pallida ATCC 43644]|uniref:Conserved repeat domain protein n=1 Tax=Isosphaera pallida (strain ATCC 43644 / DSM 9630 / IS1B) TaxID=575540 RepID=E8QZ85_ISOPI|nr:DUF11 domain-containing protein [Isosphaera pallida]ADV64214.1 conserved repeat domain protein [Isosphaera pallida ATCC 43644]
MQDFTTDPTWLVVARFGPTTALVGVLLAAVAVRDDAAAQTTPPPPAPASLVVPASVTSPTPRSPLVSELEQTSVPALRPDPAVAPSVQPTLPRQPINPALASTASPPEGSVPVVIDGSIVGETPSSIPNAGSPVIGSPMAGSSVTAIPTETTARVPLGPGTGPVTTALEPGVELISFRLPEGVTVEVMAPTPESFTGARATASMFALRIGQPYRLRIANIPNRPLGTAIYPIVEVKGRLHRPAEIDPTTFPIRLVVTEEEINQVLDGGRLITQLVYLERPETALPIALDKDDLPTLDLDPSENPLQVVRRLGRVMAVVQLGGRVPTSEDLAALMGPGDLGAGVSPFRGGAPSLLPECPPDLGPDPFDQAVAANDITRLPKDEYLCDGGDQTAALRPQGDPRLMIDPKDAVVRFAPADSNRLRSLPTNVVCVYAPRFAQVRLALGLDGATLVAIPTANETLASHEQKAIRQAPDDLIERLAPIAARHRSRASGLNSLTGLGQHHGLVILQEEVLDRHLAGFVDVTSFQIAETRQRFSTLSNHQRAEGIMSLEAAVVAAVSTAAGQLVVIQRSDEVSSDERVDRPALAVVKMVNTKVAEPGDVVTFAIRYRNVGNVPLKLISVADSLLPRFEYVEGSSKAPEGTIFTTVPNKGGSNELRWEIPGELQPGEEGVVSFEARVR